MFTREIAQQRVELHLERHFKRKVWHRAATSHRANRFKKVASLYPWIDLVHFIPSCDLSYLLSSLLAIIKHFSCTTGRKMKPKIHLTSLCLQSLGKDNEKKKKKKKDPIERSKSSFPFFFINKLSKQILFFPYASRKNWLDFLSSSWRNFLLFLHFWRSFLSSFAARVFLTSTYV